MDAIRQLPQMNDPRLFGAAGVVLLVGLWLVWALARRIVRIGFFLIAFAAGTAIAAGLSAATSKPQPWPILAAEGLVFAWAWSLFRSRVARIVSGFVLLGIVKAALTLMPGVVPDPSKLPEEALKQFQPHEKPTKP